MGKKEPIPAEAGKANPTVTNYYSVVLKPSEDKNQEEILKTEEIIVLSPEINDTSNDNSTTTTHNIWPEEATTMGTNTTPVDDD